MDETNYLLGRKKVGGKHGKVVKEEHMEITLLNREVVVVVFEYKSGLQKSICFFKGNSKSYLTKDNMLLRKKIVELERKLREVKNE